MELISHLASQLPDTVDELNENRGTVGVCVVFIAVTDALKKKTGQQGQC